MSIASDIIRGHTDTIILSQLVKNDSYGYAINRMIVKLSGGAYELKEATLYTAFRRLEQENYIEAYWGDGDAGARRKYYRITAAGRSKYTELAGDWIQARDILNRLIVVEG